MVMTYLERSRILNVAARQHLGKRMAHQFGDALLALGGSGILIETFGHWYPPGLDRICRVICEQTGRNPYAAGESNRAPCSFGTVTTSGSGSACADPE